MWFCGLGAVKANLCNASTGAGVPKDTMHSVSKEHVKLVGLQTVKQAEVDGGGGAILTAENDACERMSLAQERARKLIEEFPKREAEHIRRRELAIEAAAKEKVDMFLMAHAYGGVNAKRTKLLNSKYPLHTAVKLREVETINLLLRAKANPCVKNSAGQTPLQLAQSINDDRLVAALSHAAAG